MNMQLPVCSAVLIQYFLNNGMSAILFDFIVFFDQVT